MRELCRVQFRDFRVREIGYAAGTRMSRHAHDYSNVTAILAGEFEETTDHAERHGRSCSVVVKPAGTSHANHVTGRLATRTISLEIADGSPLAAELGGWAWLDEPGAARSALALQRAVGGGDAAAIESCALALFAAATSAAGRAEGRVPRWLEEVRAVLDARFDEPLRFEVLAAEHGLHPVYVSRAFRQHVGVSMGEYVRALRLRHARHLLGTTRRTIASIAAESGFADPSHLSRVFAAEHDMTPREFRRIAAGA